MHARLESSQKGLYLFVLCRTRGDHPRGGPAGPRKKARPLQQNKPHSWVIIQEPLASSGQRLGGIPGRRDVRVLLHTLPERRHITQIIPDHLLRARPASRHRELNSEHKRQRVHPRDATLPVLGRRNEYIQKSRSTRSGGERCYEENKAGLGLGPELHHALPALGLQLADSRPGGQEKSLRWMHFKPQGDGGGQPCRFQAKRMPQGLWAK